ncbi:NADH dehydrogenase [ubiquinone] 1 beta subcomplex subunit 9-like [Oncorhynchus nerka]|uniref:NADH dehydrogenase [ubiquinone] 1 beta subcomplex subunit 9-like n=1 Tax=Oncorhynchus nerka TaxID=8023 RepID=UPI0031B81948
MYKVPEWCLDHWHPSDGHVSYFAKREQWKNLREQSWDREVQELQGVTPAIGPSRRPYPQSARTATCPLCGGSTPPAPGSAPSFSPRMTLPGNNSKWQLTTVPSTTQQHADSPPCEFTVPL